SRRLACPSMLFCQVGEFESSKSAMKTFAPEFNALMIILRSTGPVISTRRSSRSAGIGAPVPSPSRPLAVSWRKSGSWPESISCWRIRRRASNSCRRGSNSRASFLRKAHASGVRIRVSTSFGRAAAVVIAFIVEPILTNRRATRSNWTTCPQRTAQLGSLAEMGFTAIGRNAGRTFANMEILSTSEMTKYWHSNSRWTGTKRPYTSQQVEKLRGSIQVEHTLACLGAERLWWLLHNEDYVPALGALTGNQAVQQVQAGLKAIYLSGWQVAADANASGQVYPDQSLYPVDSVPNVVRRINNALLRADQIHHMEGKNGIHWMAPIVADAEAGFGGTLNAFELMKGMIEAGAACVHFEDQLSSAKKCGHLGGKVLVPTSEAIQKLVAARLAADVLGVPTLIMARTDANSAHLLTSDIDPRDREFLTGERTSEGFFCIRGGLDSAIARGLAYAPYADLIWCETAEPNLDEARRFAAAIHAKYPGKLLA